MKTTNLYTNILKKLSSQKEQNIMGLSFLNEIIYYTTHINDKSKFISRAADVISKYIGPSAIYLLDDIAKTIYLEYSTIRNIPDSIALNNYNKFIKTLIRKGSSDFNVKEMESSKDISECVSFYKKFSVLPLVVRNVKLPLGIIVIDIDLYKVELAKLQTLNTAIVLISNSISYSKLIANEKTIAKNLIKFILEVIRLNDLSTYRHSVRVTRYSIEIAKIISLPEKKLKRLHLSSLLHDLGKISIPYEILHKEQKLSEQEFEIIKQHTTVGYNLLKNFSFFSESLPDILNHHEKIDGSGYPNGIKEIDTVTQIIAVADIIDAIASTRSYKEDKGFYYITDELEKLNGKINEDIIRAAIRFINSNKFLSIKKRFKTSKESAKKKTDISIGNLQEKIHQLKTENQSLLKQVELYKKLLNKSQKTIESMSQQIHPENKTTEQYKNIIKTIFDSINPMSIVFTKIDNASLTIARVKGAPINLENSVQLLSNKKILRSVLSGNIYISRTLLGFPLSNDEAICVFLSKNSKSDDKTIEFVRQHLQNIANITIK